MRGIFGPPKVQWSLDLRQATNESRQCSDLLSQAHYHVARARKIDEQEREIRRKQEEEREAIRTKQMQDQQEKQRLKEEMEKKLIEQREQYLEKTRSIVKIDMIIEEEPSSKKKRMVCRMYRTCTVLALVRARG